jgi:hypothetical protein
MESRATWRYIPEDSTLHNHRCENLKSYIYYNFVWHMCVLKAHTFVQTEHWYNGSKINGCHPLTGLILLDRFVWIYFSPRTLNFLYDVRITGKKLRRRQNAFLPGCVVSAYFRTSKHTILHGTEEELHYLHRAVYKPWNLVLNYLYVSNRAAWLQILYNIHVFSVNHSCNLFM